MQEQLARGTYGSPEEVIELALETLAIRSVEQSRHAFSAKSPAEAVASIQENRKDVTLGGIRIKDLINEGRKY